MNLASPFGGFIIKLHTVVIHVCLDTSHDVNLSSTTFQSWSIENG